MTSKAVWAQLLHRTIPGVPLREFQTLLGRLGNPQEQYLSIHVAGTNGKGSVCHLCAAGLQQAGYKTGLFISPHVQNVRERIQINGRPIPERHFAALVREVLSQEEQELNFFQILTAVAFLYFAHEKVDYAVVETGLGGRKDPTVFCRPAVSVITSIGRDHWQLLGGNLPKIAAEKAGIIKPGVPVFCGDLPAAARPEVRAAARRQKALLQEVHIGEPFTAESINWARGLLRLRKGRSIWRLHTLGEYQAANACLAYQVLRYLGVAQGTIKKAFAQVCIPARFEIIRRGKTEFILDGAHNAPAIEAMAAFLKKSPWDRQMGWVCGFMQDKDYPAMMHVLRSRVRKIYIAQLPGPRAAALADIRAALPKGIEAAFFPTVKAALRAAEQEQDRVLVTGSFYLAQALYAYARVRH